ncbi:unnamed protein product [Mesocestoides corti]|uniref:Golgi apparatus membrane protein TVP23 homolog n=1 Tax=Mesocestoides corti TaxID=53468 RepID=A0A0R3UGT2_MESCO|nr:unnamed protein product [Mesocestoides corti]
MDANSRDDVVLTLTQDDDALVHEQVRRRRLALICHFSARSIALLFYLFCSWFTTAFIAPVVILLTLFAVDFWLVKNVSGRLLVGLRWWNSIDTETGASKWVFESAPKDNPGGVPLSTREQARKKSAARLFWLGLLVFPLIWAILVLVAVFSLKLAWCLVALSALFACSVNAYGYLRCRFKSTPILGGESSSSSSSLRGILSASLAKSVISDLWSGGDEGQRTQPQPQSTLTSVV